ncbi:ABC transporter, partial [Calderihabitans maritimus]
MAGKAG